MIIYYGNPAVGWTWYDVDAGLYHVSLSKADYDFDWSNSLLNKDTE